MLVLVSVICLFLTQNQNLVYADAENDSCIGFKESACVASIKLYEMSKFNKFQSDPELNVVVYYNSKKINEIVDGKPETYYTFNFKKGMVITAVLLPQKLGEMRDTLIIAGCNTNREKYYNYARIKSMDMSFEFHYNSEMRRDAMIARFSDDYKINILPTQAFMETFNRKLVIRYKINEIYPGKSFKNKLCISEIKYLL